MTNVNPSRRSRTYKNNIADRRARKLREKQEKIASGSKKS
jgi:hypothetical protein